MTMDRGRVNTERVFRVLGVLHELAWELMTWKQQLFPVATPAGQDTHS